MSDQVRHTGGMRPLPAFLLSPLSAIPVMKLIGFSIEGDMITAAIFLYILFLFPQLIIAAPLRWFLAKRGWQSLWVDSGLGAIALAIPTAALSSSLRKQRRFPFTCPRPRL